MSDQWKKFWKNYVGDAAADEDDLYVQVGKTAKSSCYKRWWTKFEFINIAEKFNLKIEIFDQSNEYSYRMSILLYS